MHACCTEKQVFDQITQSASCKQGLSLLCRNNYMCSLFFLQYWSLQLLLFQIFLNECTFCIWFFGQSSVFVDLLAPAPGNFWLSNSTTLHSGWVIKKSLTSHAMLPSLSMNKALSSATKYLQQRPETSGPVYTHFYESSATYLSTWYCALNKLVCHLAVIASASFFVGLPDNDANTITTLFFFDNFINSIGLSLNFEGSNPAMGFWGFLGSCSSYLSSSSMSSSLS